MPVAVLTRSASAHVQAASRHGVGGLAGVACSIGIALLGTAGCSTRASAPPARRYRDHPDAAWAQLALGLLTVPVSAQHMDGALFPDLVNQGIVLCILAWPTCSPT